MYRLLALCGCLLAGGCGAPRFHGVEPPPPPPPIEAPAPLPPGATPPEVVHRPTMVLPQGWMLLDLVARVRMRVAVDAEGRPRQTAGVDVDGGPLGIRGPLGDLAVQTVAGWRFRPAMIDGRPVPAWADVDLEVDLPAWWAAVYDAPEVPPLPPGARPPKRVGDPLEVWPRMDPSRRRGSLSAVAVVEVRPDGTAGAVWVARSSSDRAFDLAVVEALRQQRFEPARAPDGQPRGALHRVALRGHF